VVTVEALLYIGIIVGLVVIAGLLRYTVFSPMPRTITSLQDAEKLVDYQVRAANRRLRREAWMLTFVVSHFDPETRTVSVRLGINYGRRGYPDYVGRFQQMWANAQVMLRAKEKIADAFARRAFRATVETFT
jgi:hypothetical protein